MTTIRLASIPPGRRYHWVVAVCLLTTVMVVMSACGGSSGGGPPKQSGPARILNEANVVVGMDPPRGERYPTLGTLVMENGEAGSDATLGEIRLGRSNHLRVKDSWVLPMISEMQFGVGFFVPPEESGFPDPEMDNQWVARQELTGYHLAPGEQVNVLIAIDTDDPCGGTSEWVELTYYVQGRRYLAVAPFTGIEMSDDASPNCVG